MTTSLYLMAHTICLPISSLQVQYVFIHTTLDEIITSGEPTEIDAENIRIAVIKLRKENDGVTGFQRQFEASQANTFLHLYF